MGIVLGSWWAYRELGWGGWWFWDPVENASFLPWLMGTALIHSLIVTEKRNVFKAWTVLLAIAAFSLSLMGTFLVRSGVLVSVHTFAVDPQRGAFMLGFLFVVIAGSLSLYAWRAHTIRESIQFDISSRETVLLSNNIILLVVMLTVLLGTLYPLMIDALGLGKLSVGAPYFNAVFVPLMLPFIFLLGLGPYFHWQQAKIASIISRVRYVFLLAVLLTFLLLGIAVKEFKLAIVIELALAIWVLLATSQHFWLGKKGHLFTRMRTLTASQLGMILAHWGVAVTVIGIILTSAYTQEREVRLAPKEQVNIGDYHFQLLGEKNIQGPNYRATTADLLVTKNDQVLMILQPEKRLYTVQQMATSKAAISAGIFRDLYVALGDPIGEQTWSVRIYNKPFVRWIWAGGFLMVAGGVIALFDKRYRMKKEVWSWRAN
jgi:cytochrome c-type biogenesis protein CcmF